MPPEYPVPGVNCDSTLVLPRLLYEKTPGAIVQQSDLVQWVLNGSAGTISRKPLLIVTGSPGSGKTWLMCNLWQMLSSRDGPACYWFDCVTDIDDSPSIEPWRSRYEGALRQLEGSPMRGRPVSQIAAQLRTNHGSPTVLLVDAYDDLNDKQRNFLEQRFLVPYLETDGQQSVRLVIALRDPIGVKAPALTQEMATLTLVPLSAIDQIRLRCEQLTKANETRHNAEPDEAEAIAAYEEAIQLILEPPDALKDDDLARLYERSSEELEQIQSGLRDKLTGNPYINNLLLWYALCGNDNDLSSEQIEKIWEHYLRRARLLDETGEPKIQIPLLEQIHTELGAEWTELDFGLKFGYPKMDEAGPLFDQGVIVTGADNDFYQIHPDVVALLQLRLSA